jgi:adenylosuccinate synthase
MQAQLNGLGIVVVGGQWGDEGKGRIVDALSEKCDVTVRFQGGNNAGHSLYFGDKSIVLHLIPCGVVRGKPALIGNGVVVDPEVLLKEIALLKQLGIICTPQLLRISRHAHVILPLHKELDGFREDHALTKIGTTKRGIGPTYEHKVARIGLRVVDLCSPTRVVEKITETLTNCRETGVALTDQAPAMIKLALKWGEQLRPFMADVGEEASQAIAKGQRVLFEGAQGALLDVDHGTYPFVTSSNCVAGQAATGTGIGPRHLTDVLMVTKAYCTRVGEGPFFSECDASTGEKLRALGHEYGATTGRARRCGWLDLPALKYAARLNGATGLVMTKIDVLAQMGEFKVVVAYRSSAGGATLTFNEAMEIFDNGGQVECETIHMVVDGTMPEQASKISDFPASMQRFLRLVEEKVGVQIRMISYGKHRGQEFWTHE